MNPEAQAYDRRAQQHRPQTKADIAPPVKQLLAQGLTHRDVSTLLGLSIADVVSAAETRIVSRSQDSDGARTSAMCIDWSAIEDILFVYIKHIVMSSAGGALLGENKINLPHPGLPHLQLFSGKREIKQCDFST